MKTYGCNFQRLSARIGDSEHQKGWIHLDRPSCPEGAACAKDKQIHFEDLQGTLNKGFQVRS